MTFHTEEEASEKWCPFMGEGTILTNTAHSCVGSKCMAWRWSRVKETKGYLEAVQKRMEEHKGTARGSFESASSFVFKDAKLFEETEGYCGLASKGGT